MEIIGTLCSVVLLLQAVFFTFALSQEPIDMCACRYHFVEQPSISIMCNPYPTGHFITHCIVDYSTNEGLPLQLSWYSRASLSTTPQRLTSGFTTVTGSSRIQSELNIALAAGNEQNYEGFRYFCRVSFFNGTTLSDSQIIYLFPRSVTEDVLSYPDCNDSSVHSTLLPECIDPNYRPESQTTTPPPVLTTTSTTTMMPTPPKTTTTPEELTTTMEPTTEEPTPPATTAEPTTPPPPPPTTPPPPPPTTPPPKTSPPTTPPPPVTTTRQVSQNPLSFEEEVLLYSAIVAAVVLVVIIVVLILCLCCWNRVCQRSRYCTCYSKY